MFFAQKLSNLGPVLHKPMQLKQARSQKFVMGGAVWGVWGQSPQPPETNGGLGAKLPAAGGWGFGGKAPSRRRHGGLGAEPPALENFAFFAKITKFYGYFE